MWLIRRTPIAAQQVEGAMTRRAAQAQLAIKCQGADPGTVSSSGLRVDLLILILLLFYQQTVGNFYHPLTHRHFGHSGLQPFQLWNRPGRELRFWTRRGIVYRRVRGGSEGNVISFGNLAPICGILVQ